MKYCSLERFTFTLWKREWIPKVNKSRHLCPLSSHVCRMVLRLQLL